jgi:hypothetical protein
MALRYGLECDYIARVAYDRTMRARPRVPGPLDRLSFMPSADGSLVLKGGPNAVQPGGFCIGRCATHRGE